MNLVIAGASGGIGGFLVRNFDKKENFLILTKNSSEITVLPRFAKYEIHKCNFTKDNEVKAFYAKISVIDVLINAIATVENSLIEKMSLDTWMSVIENNLNTVFLSCKYALPKMKENSHIINIPIKYGIIMTMVCYNILIKRQLEIRNLMRPYYSTLFRTSDKDFILI